MNYTKKHRAWLVMIGTILIQAGMTGIFINCTGILFSAIIGELHLKAGELSVYYMIRSFASSIAVGITTKLFFKYPAKYVMTALGIILCSSFAAMCFFTELWQWYLAAVFAGIGISCAMVAIPVVLNNWFHSNNGLVVGLTMSASGISGAIFGPICSGLISAFGWRVTAVLMAGAGILLIAVPSLLVLSATPEEVGCCPYGEKQRGTARARQKQEVMGESHAGYTPAWVFPLSMVALLSVSSLTQFNNQIPTYAQSIGFDIATGAIMASFSMVGNVVGKLSLGVLTDRIGIYRSIQLLVILIAGSMGIFLYGDSSLLLLNAGAFVYGLVFALMATAPALLYLDLYGIGTYRKKVSQLQAVSGIVMALLSTIFPYLYDWTGNFQLVFVYGAVACAMSCIIFTKLQNFSKDRKE